MTTKEAEFNISFKEKLVNDLIPFLKGMVDKEEKHLNYLERKKSPKRFIDRSKSYLKHYQERYLEYVEYAEKL